MKFLREKDEIPAYPDKSILDTFPAPKGSNLTIVLESSEFTSLCPITGQPDYSKITIYYCPGSLCLETKSFKYYLFSFRNSPGFIEEVTHRIYNDLHEVLEPSYLQVKIVTTPRGGICLTAEEY